MTFTTCSLLTLHLNHYIHYNSKAVLQLNLVPHITSTPHWHSDNWLFRKCFKMFFTRKIIQPRTEAVDTFLKMLTDMFLFRLFKLWSKTENIWKSLLRVASRFSDYFSGQNTTGGVQITTVCIFPVCSCQHRQGRRIPSGSLQSCPEVRWPWTCQESGGLRGPDPGETPVFVSRTRPGRTRWTTSAGCWNISKYFQNISYKTFPYVNWVRPGRAGSEPRLSTDLV